MRTEDQGPYMAATALAFGGMMVGYYLTPVAMILLVGVALGVIAARIGGAGGAGVARLLAPLAALGRWLVQKDDGRMVRLSPVIGLAAGWLFRWVVTGLQAQGGA